MRQLIAAECARTPDASDREIARRLGVSHRTVAAVRRPEVDNLSTTSTTEERPRVTYEEAIAGMRRIALSSAVCNMQYDDDLEAGVPPATIASELVQSHRKLSAETNDPEFSDTMWRYVYGPRVESILSWDGTTEYAWVCDWCNSEGTSKRPDAGKRSFCSLDCWEADLRYRTREAAAASRG
jgi:hypothetical protein